MIVMISFFLPLLLLIPSATPLNFTFDTFNDTNRATIHTEGAAYIDTEFLRLTKTAEYELKTKSVGRATYHQPFLLRENSTGKLADFTTSFQFAIESKNLTSGDGLTFFIAPNGSLLNTTLGEGSSLGLPFNSAFSNDTTLVRSQYPFVAVEFDIFTNLPPFGPASAIADPPPDDGFVNAADHVGIDVNSLNSSSWEPWYGGILGGKTNKATITYNSTSKNLSVAFTSFVNASSQTQVMRNLFFIVDLTHYFPDWVIVGFSAATGASVALHKIISWDFNSTQLGEVGVKSSPMVPGSNPISIPNSGNKNAGLGVGLGVGGSVALLGGLGLVWFILRKNRGAAGASSSDEDNPMVNEFIDEDFEKGAGPRKFSYIELAQATGHFGEGEKLGEGGFGGVYKGFIPDLKSFVAVKKISRGSKQGIKEYASEVRIISRLRHRNLVQLIGWCHEKKFMLVYEFMPNGSLDSHLFKEHSFLTWESRYKIAQGLASGLFYLHEEWEQCVLHRDIKSSNVMLDSNFNAKLGDFGLARLVDHGKLSQTTMVAGTMGYMAPDYFNTGKASKASDVFSFGVVALEITCGRKPIDPTLASTQINMVEWVWNLYGEERVIEAADPKLGGDFDDKQMKCLMTVGLWCAHPDYSIRPSIQQAIQVLNFEAPLPNLPSKMPVATYFAPPRSLSKLSSDTSGSQGGQTQSSSSGYSYSTNSLQLTASSSSTNMHPR